METEGVIEDVSLSLVDHGGKVWSLDAIAIGGALGLEFVSWRGDKANRVSGVASNFVDDGELHGEEELIVVGIEAEVAAESGRAGEGGANLRDGWHCV